ncbi:MAG: hypothetical protein DRQ39_09595 [Gammaproteobacteria bacterium]|nr:MAG: hypothetical protein DRQ39_09595 [Gammaproteobacteria bacterium]
MTDSAMLPNKIGNTMTRFNVTQRLKIAVDKASKTYKELLNKKISPHTIRHYIPFLTISSKMTDTAHMS